MGSAYGTAISTCRVSGREAGTHCEHCEISSCESVAATHVPSMLLWGRLGRPSAGAGHAVMRSAPVNPACKCQPRWHDACQQEGTAQNVCHARHDSQATCGGRWAASAHRPRSPRRAGPAQDAKDTKEKAMGKERQWERERESVSCPGEGGRCGQREAPSAGWYGETMEALQTGLSRYCSCCEALEQLPGYVC